MSPSTRQSRQHSRGAALTGYALTLSVLVGSALGGVNLVRDQSGEFLIDTGQQIGERRQTREEILEGTIPIAPDWVPDPTTTTSTTEATTTTSTTAPTTTSTTAAPTTTTTAAPTTTTTAPTTTTTAAPTTTTTAAPTTTTAPVNLAKNKPATVSSRWSNSYNGPANVTDGNTDGSWYGNSLTSTDYEKNPSIQVNLQSTTYIGSVKVWNTTESWAQGNRKMWIIVSNSPISTSLNTAKNNATFSVLVTGVIGRPTTVPVGVSGKYVSLFVEGNNETLDIAEIEIFG